MLEHLIQLYEQQAAHGEAPRYGWEVRNVSYALQLDAQGKLVGIQSLMRQEQRGKKMVDVPRTMSVPKGPTRTSGVQPLFLCDNAKYLLGFDDTYLKKDELEPEAYDKAKHRIEQCFTAAKEYHLQLLADVKSPVAQAVCAFFRSWQIEPAILLQNRWLQQEIDGLAKGANLVFRVGEVFAEDDAAVQEAWQQVSGSDTAGAQGLCMLTGQRGTLARIHPLIKGVTGTQASGAALISYNKGKQAYESFGKENAQAYNAPISEYAAFAYTTALNLLLADRTHVKRFGDTTVVYWAEEANEACQDIFADLCEDESRRHLSNNDLNALFEQVKQGRPLAYRDMDIPYENHFYILGLSPNSARISVRFFLQGSFGDFLQHFAQHAERMRIDRPGYIMQEGVSLWQLLNETVNAKAAHKEASPLLAGAVFRAIAQDLPYPEALYQQILLRLKSEQGKNKVNYRRVAMIKAYLIKNKRRVVTVSLDERAAEPAYVLGRLFAELENIQVNANPEINSTIKDKYFNAACATPAAIFPVLQKLSQHHLRKLSPGSKIYHEKLLGSIMDLLNLEKNSIPRQLSLEQQGVFILGYYHQKQAFYKGKEASGRKENE
jgi:CRISPR-associated protein Csd1